MTAPFIFIKNKEKNYSYYLGESYDTENEISTLITNGCLETKKENLEEIISYLNKILQRISNK